MAGNYLNQRQFNDLLNRYNLPTKEDVEALNQNMQMKAESNNPDQGGLGSPPVEHSDLVMNPESSGNNTPDLKRQRFLKAMAHIESNNGQNLNHQPAQIGVNAGDVALGKYGFMPNTIRELAPLAGHPELSDADDSTIQKQFENAGIQDKFANAMYNKLNEQTDDPEKQAVMWQFGHNKVPSDLSKKNYQNRLKKFRVLNSY